MGTPCHEGDSIHNTSTNIKELYPEAKRIEWTHNVVRGGHMPGDQPAAVGAPHLDYHQNDTARVEFHKERPVFSPGKNESVLIVFSSEGDF